MSLRSAMAGALTFAHLNGVAAKTKSEDDDKNKDKDESEAANAAASGDDEETKAAEDPKDGDGGKDGKNGKNGKNGKKAEDESDDGDPDKDDDEEELKGKSEAARARRRERARCAAIFAAPEAARNVALAASLAFETSMTRKEAVAVLRKMPRGASALAERMAGLRNPDLGPAASDTPKGRAAIDASWDAAMSRAGAAPRK